MTKNPEFRFDPAALSQTDKALLYALLISVEIRAGYLWSDELATLMGRYRLSSYHLKRLSAMAKMNLINMRKFRGRWCFSLTQDMYDEIYALLGVVRPSGMGGNIPF
jgi:hypothetical protein